MNNAGLKCFVEICSGLFADDREFVYIEWSRNSLGKSSEVTGSARGGPGIVKVRKGPLKSHRNGKSAGRATK